MRAYFTLTLHCGRCSRIKEVSFDAANMSAEDLIRAAAVASGRMWVIQRNGDTLDTYCSKKCAA